MRRLWVSLLLALAVSVAGLAAPLEAPAHHGSYVTGRDYGGYRWPSGSICVDDRTGSFLSDSTANAAFGRNGYYDVRPYLLVRRAVGSTACNSWAQEVILVAGYYGQTGWAARTLWGSGWRPTCSTRHPTNCDYWGKTAGGHWTWLHRGDLVIQFNKSYSRSSTFWLRATLHEGGHALVGLIHARCGTWSMMNVPNCNWTSYPTTYDKNNIDNITRQ